MSDVEVPSRLPVTSSPRSRPWRRYSAGHRRTRHRERTWLATFLLMLVIVGSWSLATPLTAGADEYGHVFTAYAVAHGETGSTVQTEIGPLEQVDVPRELAVYQGAPGCFAFSADQPANCPLISNPGPALVQFMNYPRPYYLAIGAPSLFLHGQMAFVGARMVTVVLCSLLLGTALWAQQRWWKTSRSGLAMLVAVTPQVLSQSASLGSSGIEICAGLSLSMCLLIMAKQSGRVERSLLVAVVASAAALVQSRPLSPAWALLIVVVAAVVAGRPRSFFLIRDRSVQLAAGAVVIVAVAAVGWTLSQGTPQLLGLPDPRLQDPQALLSAELGRIANLWGGRVGRFGWGASQVSNLGMAVWAAALAVLLLAALRGSVTGRDGRRGFAVVACAVVVVAVVSLDTLVLEAPQAPAVGLFWSSRYDMPVAVTIAVLLAGPLDTSERVAGVRLLRITGVALLCVQSSTFVSVIHRYLVGQSTPLELFGPTAWMPTIPWQLITGVAVLGLVGLTALSLRSVPWADPSTTGRRQSRAPESGHDPRSRRRRRGDDTVDPVL